MQIQIAKQIIETLAQGINPVTGEVFDEDSPYNAPPVIRALFKVYQELDQPAFSPVERDAILAGLRMLQQALTPGKLPRFTSSIEEILTNDDAHPAISLEDIDALCERLNQ
jgi:hypothetical protein